MAMRDFVLRDAILVPLSAATRDDVIRELVTALHGAGQFQPNEVEDVVKAVLRREALASTGIGRNIAIPHTRHAAVTRLVGTVGIARKPIDFDSIDNEPVDIFIMLISPQDQPGPHLRALENVVQTMKDESLVAALRAATTKDEIWNLINGRQQG